MGAGFPQQRPPYQQPGQGAYGGPPDDSGLPEWLRAGMQNGAAPQQQQPGWYAPDPGDPRDPAPPPLSPAFGQGAQAQVPPGRAGLVPGVSAQNLFDESALPEWLWQQGGTQNDLPVQPTARQPAPPYGAPPPGYVPAQPPVPYQPYQQPAPAQAPYPPSSQASAFPGIESAGAFGAASASSDAMSARSLLDASAMPSWLGGSNAAPPQSMEGGRTGGGMQAQSLVDENALPSWLRAQPNPQPQPPAAAYSGQPQPEQWAGSQSMSVPLPTWMRQVYAEASAQQQVMQPQPPQGPQPWGTPAAPGMPGAGASISASEFLDQSALPEWMRGQAAAEYPSAANGVPGPANAPANRSGDAAGMRFSASDLIDPGVLPNWVGGNNAPPPPSSPVDLPSTTRQPAMDARDTGRQPIADASAAAYGQPQRPPDGSGRLRPGGTRAADGPQNQGAPIPRDELPPWLQNGGGPHPQPQGAPHRPPAQRNRGMDWAGEDMPQQWQDAPDFPGGEYDGYDYDDGYANGGPSQRYPVGYGGYDGYDRQNAMPTRRGGDDELQGKKRGGWRRIFGR